MIWFIALHGANNVNHQYMLEFVSKKKIVGIWSWIPTATFIQAFMHSSIPIGLFGRVNKLMNFLGANVFIIILSSNEMDFLIGDKFLHNGGIRELYAYTTSPWRKIVKAGKKNTKALHTAKDNYFIFAFWQL